MEKFNKNLIFSEKIEYNYWRYKIFFMKSEIGHLPRLTKINCQITSAVILCISAYLIIPKLVFSTEKLNIFNTKSWSHSVSPKSTALKAKNHGVEGVYVPPNYGGPDSQHGSGTR